MTDKALEKSIRQIAPGFSSGKLHGKLPDKLQHFACMKG